MQADAAGDVVSAEIAAHGIAYLAAAVPTRALAVLARTGAPKKLATLMSSRSTQVATAAAATLWALSRNGASRIRVPPRDFSLAFQSACRLAEWCAKELISSYQMDDQGANDSSSSDGDVRRRRTTHLRTRLIRRLDIIPRALGFATAAAWGCAGALAQRSNLAELLKLGHVASWVRRKRPYQYFHQGNDHPVAGQVNTLADITALDGNMDVREYAPTAPYCAHAALAVCASEHTSRAHSTSYTTTDHAVAVGRAMLDARPSLLKESLRALERSSSLGAAHAAAATLQHLLKSIDDDLLDKFARENDAVGRLFGVLDMLDDLDNANAQLDEQVESTCDRYPPPPQH